MCKYTYYRFEECSHCVIEVSQICNMKLWMGGMKAAVISCQEKYFTGPVVEGDMAEVGKWKWWGMRGWCVGCEREFLTLTSPLPIRSYHDEVFTLTSILSDTWTDPFIHLPAIHKSVPELMGLTHQFRVGSEESPLEEGAELHFPEKFEVYQRDLKVNRKQWLRSCTSFYETPHEIHIQLRDMYGFTIADVANVGKAIAQNFRGSDIFDRVFKARGMPRTCFDDFTDKIYGNYVQALQSKKTSNRGRKKILKWKT